MAKEPNPEWLVIGEGYADVTLSRPAQFDGTATTVLRMREPTVEDQMIAAEMSGSDAARELAALANLCQVPPTDMKKLPARDWRRLQTAYLSFID